MQIPRTALVLVVFRPLLLLLGLLIDGRMDALKICFKSAGGAHELSKIRLALFSIVLL